MQPASIGTKKRRNLKVGDRVIYTQRTFPFERDLYGSMGLYRGNLPGTPDKALVLFDGDPEVTIVEQVAVSLTSGE